ncbi:MAG: tRNA pseudouridine(55) synthase TruB [Sphingomonadaceae bacterium]|nr:tRNA pseudouridine(55) synthase TruB [Sphingomonadaceae bacterium]
MLSGWLILDKPRGLGSTDAVGLVKRHLRHNGYAKTKVGHGGTLDPLAEGVLPIALGEATKLAGRMLDASKCYDFTLQFGVETDGLDAEGTPVGWSDVRPALTEIAAVLPRFLGAIDQIPPAFSAIKVDGKRAYARARAGEAVEMPPRRITIHSIDILAHNDDSVTIAAHVSKGSYIRSLARDIAHACNSVGHVTMLRRTRAGPFTLGQAISLDKLADVAMGRTLEEVLLPLEAGLDGIPALSLSPDEAKAIAQGRTLFGQSVKDGDYLAMDGTRPLALVNITGGASRILRGFNL